MNGHIGKMSSSRVSCTMASRALPLASSLIIVLVVPLPLLATTFSESESNSNFSDRNVVPDGTDRVTGNLDFEDFDEEFPNNTLSSEQVLGSFPIAGTVPGGPFVAWIDNDIGNGTPDTVLGHFDAGGTLLDSNDDGGPLVDTLGSLLTGNADAGGDINLMVPGCCDSFAGTHGEQGSFDLFIRYSAGAYDVDFFEFANLPVNEPFRAEVVNANFDSFLGFLDSSGTIIKTNDDSGDGLLSRLFENVPGDGRVILAVTGFDDFDFLGNHKEEPGSYELEFELGAIPEPAQYAFLLSAFLAGAALARDRRRK